MDYLIIYLFLINALGLILMLADKQKAKKNQWRIPEGTLLGIAMLGGSIGSLLGMCIARHKTKKSAFTVGIPLILLMQIATLWVLITKSDIF